MNLSSNNGLGNPDIEANKTDRLNLLKQREILRNTVNNKSTNTRQSPSGVSIITGTNRPYYMEKVFANYQRQSYAEKELIVVLNDNQMNIEEWNDRAQQFDAVRVFQLDESKTLADCLNLAISHSKYPYISKFDDDNYYAPEFVSDIMDVFHNIDAHIVGKRAYYTYLENKKMLILRFPTFENRYVSFLSGSAMVVKKEVFEKVKFTPVVRGTDTIFLKDCLANKFKIYSADRFNYVYVRKLEGERTTWPIKDEELLANNCKIIGVMDHYCSYVTV